MICGPHFENFWCKNSDEQGDIHKDISLLFPRENLPSRFKFKEYCPMVFRNLRERFGIDDQDYQVRVSTESEEFGSRVGSGSHRSSRGKKCPLFLCCVLLSCFFPAQAVFCMLAGSWRGECLRSASDDASQAQAPLSRRENGGRERGLRKWLHFILTIPV